MTKDANAKSWGLTAAWNGRVYSDPANVPEAAWQLPEGHFEPTKIALTLITPRGSDIGENSRYRRTYTGLPWRVPVGVIGGAWPYHYEIVTAPDGVTLGADYGDSDYGVLEWEAPTSGSHSFSIRIHDQEGAYVDADWTLVVNTSGAIFVDSAVAPGGSGSLASPFSSIQEFWGSDRTDGTYSGYHVYFRQGSSDYTLNDNWDVSWPNPGSCPWRTSKPLVLVAYPGETPSIDTAEACFLCNDSGSPDFFVGGLRFKGASTYPDIDEPDFSSTFKIYGTHRAVFFENVFGDQGSDAIAGTNPAHIFSDGVNYLSVIRNTVNDLNGRMLATEAYNILYGLYEHNQINGQEADSIAIYLKTNNSNITVRRNTGLTGLAGYLCRIDTYADSENIELCFNNYKTTGIAAGAGLEANALSGDIWDYRNTWQTPYNGATFTASGQWTVANNVIVHDGTFANGYGNLDGAGVTFGGLASQLAATAATDVIDPSTGELTGAGLSQLGLKGHQVAA